MITLENVTILKPGFRRRDPILEDATAAFHMGERTGILAAPGTGKSTIARLLSGIEPPDFGRVQITGKVSWPIGFAGFLHPGLNVRDNLETFARLNGLAPEDVSEFCEEFCNNRSLLQKQMADLTPTQRALLGYACAMSNPSPAMWVADEVISVGEPRDRKVCEEVLEERLRSGGLVFLSRNIRLLKLYCDRFFALIDRRLVPCDDLNHAQVAIERLAFERSLAMEACSK